MNAEYLKNHVGAILPLALTQTILAKPDDPVGYLAQCLLNLVDSQRQTEQARARTQQQRSEDDKFEQEQQRVLAQQQAEADAKEKARTDHHNAIRTFLATTNLPVPTLLDKFLTHLSHVIAPGASAYVVHADADDSIKYVAATPDSKDLIDQRVKKGQGVLFDLLEDDAPAGGADEDGAGGSEKPADAGKPKRVFVPSTVVGPLAARLHFFNKPSAGSFLGVRVKFDSLLDENVLVEWREKEREREQSKKDEGDAKAAAAAAGDDADGAEGGGDGAGGDGAGDDDEEHEDDDDETKERKRASRAARAEREQLKARLAAETPEERQARLEREAIERARAEELALINSLTKKKRAVYIVCVDTVKSHARLSDEDVETVSTYAAQLVDTLQRLDRKVFKEEKSKRELRVRPIRGDGSGAGGDGAAEEDEQEEEEEEQEDEAAAADGDGAAAAAAADPLSKIADLPAETAEQRSEASSELEAAGHATTNEDVSYALMTRRLYPKRHYLVAMSTYAFLSQPSVDVVALFLVYLGHPRAAVSDKAMQSDWAKIRPLLGAAATWQTFQVYEPRAKVRSTEEEKSVNKWAQAVVASSAEPPAPLPKPTQWMLRWINEVRKVKKRQRVEEREQRRVERERRKKEKEEAAERKRREEEGGGEGGQGDEDGGAAGTEEEED